MLASGVGCVAVDLHHAVPKRHWYCDFFCDVSPSIYLLSVSIANYIAISLVLFMVPPTGIVFIFLLGTLTLVLGMALGWAWGVIAMKAAMAARPAAETQAKLQALGQAAYSQANSTGQPVAAVQQQLVYTGWMLDTRVTAVHYCLICLFIYLLVSVS
jgi:Protein of unknown function (DUF2422).